MCNCNRFNKRRRRQKNFNINVNCNCHGAPTPMMPTVRGNTAGMMDMQDNLEAVNVQEFDCGKTQEVIKHKHIVRHQHDIINQYDVVHERDFNYFDVVTEREVVRRNDFTNHTPDYCNRPQLCDCSQCVS